MALADMVPYRHRWSGDSDRGGGASGHMFFLRG
jgi:hypothetical protein